MHVHVKSNILSWITASCKQRSSIMLSLFRRVSQICLVSVKSDSQIRVGRSVANTSGFSKIVVKIWNSHKKLTEDSSKGFTPDSESRVFLVFRSVGQFTLTKHICDTRLIGN